MQKHSTHKGEQGFTVFALLLSLTALGLGIGYTLQQAQNTKFAAKHVQIEMARGTSELTNLSNIGRLKGMLVERKNGQVHEVGLYPVNYFAPRWELAKNTEVVLPALAIEHSQLRMASYVAGELSPEKVIPIFKGSMSHTALLSEPQSLVILAHNADPDHPYFIKSLDVSTSRNLDMKQAANSRDMNTIGRIELMAPVPKDVKVKVRFPDTKDFVSIDSKLGADYPPGEYKFQIFASGIVHYAEVYLGDKGPFIVGINGKGKIQHAANSIKAQDVLLGEVTQILGSPPAEPVKGNERVDIDQCRVEVTPIPSPSPGDGTGTQGSIPLLVKVYGVDGKVGPNFHQKMLFTTKPAPPPPPSDEGSLACEAMCPIKFDEFWIEPRTQAHFLDLALAKGTDTKSLDYFDPDLTNELQGRTKGIICGNMELVAQAMAKESGGKSLTEMLFSNSARFEAVRNRNMGLKRFFAYTAPSCERQLVGQRTECGCFAEDTQITMADGTQRLVREIRAGDLVWNPKTQSSYRVKRVIAGPEKIPMYRLHVGDTDVLVTKQHPFPTQRGMIPAHEVQAGDRIQAAEQGELEVSRVDIVHADSDREAPVVWNFELEGSADFNEHYVLANGVPTGDLYIQESLSKNP